MPDENRPDLRICAKPAKYMLGLSVLIILGTVIPSIFALEPYGSMCICVINYLAYAWIAFAVVILLAIISLIYVALASIKEQCCCRRMVLIRLLLVAQGLGFMLGIIFLILFAARYTNVI